MLINLLIAGIIPFVLWVIQKATQRTGPKATYIRRRIFAWGLLISCTLGIYGMLDTVSQSPESFNNISSSVLARLLIRVVPLWIGVIGYGFSPGDTIETRGFWFSIWEPYDRKHVTQIKQNKAVKDVQNQVTLAIEMSKKYSHSAQNKLIIFSQFALKKLLTWFKLLTIQVQEYILDYKDFRIESAISRNKRPKVLLRRGWFRKPKITYRPEEEDNQS